LTTTAVDIQSLFDAYRADRRRFVEDFFTIVPRVPGPPVPLHLTRSQDFYWRNKRQHTVIAKARRVHISAIVEADFTSYILLNPGTHALQILNKPIEETLHHHMPRIEGYLRAVKARLAGPDAKPEDIERMWPVLTVSNTQHKVIDFGDAHHGAKIESSITLVGSGSKSVIQGGEHQFYHITEIPDYDPGELEAIKNALMGSEYAQVVYESRPERTGDEFHTLYLDAKEGRSSYKSIFIPWFWAEEHQLPEGASLWEGADPRLADDGFPLDDDEQAMMDEHTLSWGQMRYWRRALFDAGGDYQMRSSQLAVDDVSCWRQGGMSVMPADILNAQYHQAKPPLGLEALQGWDTYGGALRVWRKPQPGEAYAIYCDPAEGLATSHDTAIVCRRASDWAYCFTVQGKFSPEESARIMQSLGVRYNEALLGWERDARSAGIRALLVGTYRNLFHYRSQMVENADEQYGLPMTQWTKEGFVLAMRDFIASGAFHTDDRVLLEQLMALQAEPLQKDRMAYDTSVLDIAIADIGCLQMRSQALRYVRPAQPVKVGGQRITPDWM